MLKPETGLGLHPKTLENLWLPLQNGKKYVIKIVSLWPTFMFSIFSWYVYDPWYFCRRSIIPSMNHVKSRNGPISPRDRDMNNSSYPNHPPQHYNSYNNSSQNHNNRENSSSSGSPNNQTPQSNSDLISYVSGAWKEKVNQLLRISRLIWVLTKIIPQSSAEVFKSENAEKLNHFDLEGWLKTRQQ